MPFLVVLLVIVLACKYNVNTELEPMLDCLRGCKYDLGVAKRRLKNRYAVEFARKGGRARAKHLSPERRREIARKAVLARWARQKAKGNPEGP